MENANTSINAEDISVEITRFYDDEANGKSVAFDKNTATFDYSYEKNKLKKPKVHIKVKNNSDKNLYFSALYCSEVYGIGNQFMKKQLINAGGEAFFLNPPTPDNENKDKRDIYFNIDSDLTKIGITEVEDYVKLLITENFGEIFYPMGFNPLCYKNTLYNGLKPIGLCAFISVLILNTTSPKFSVLYNFFFYFFQYILVSVNKKCRLLQDIVSLLY